MCLLLHIIDTIIEAYYVDIHSTTDVGPYGLRDVWQTN